MSRIETILGSRNRVKVLRVLLKKDGISGREVARGAGLSASAANIALGELVEAGAVFRNGTVGKNSFEVNRTHYLLRDISRLFENEDAIVQKMFEVARKYVNDFPSKTELLGLGHTQGDVTLVTRPFTPSCDPLLRGLKAAFKTEFGIEKVETCADLAKLTASPNTRLAIPERTRERVTPGARERSLRFFGIKEPSDHNRTGGGK